MTSAHRVPDPADPADPGVTLYGHWICPYSVRVSFALAERAIAHRVVDVPPTAVRPPGFVVPTEFVEDSPRGEIPMIRVGDTFLADSLPILEWLEERFGDRPLLPAGPGDRALVRERMAWIDARVFAPMVGVYYGTDEERIAASAAELGQALDAMSGWLSAGGWLAGDAPTLAEATVIPLYVRLGALSRLGFDGPLPPPVSDHLDRCTSLAGWESVAWSQEQTDELVARIGRHRARVRSRRDG